MAESEAARADDGEEVTEPGAGKRGGAVKLTDRDKEMLGLLVLARYMTVQQVHRLCFEGRHESLAYRRLQKLTRGDSGPPFLRQRFFRTYDGNRVAVWAPTPHGLAAAALRVGGLPELPKHDVGAQFLEHTIQLNELLVALWRTGDGRPARVAHPFCRWMPSDAVRLNYSLYEMRGEYERRGDARAPRVIQPDAVLELPSQRRRYFLECEMGGHTISPRLRKPPGATLSKVERYEEYLTGLADLRGEGTFYLAQYHDGFAAEVLFLVRSAGRANSINSALAKWRGSTVGRHAAFRAVTFDEAAMELRRLGGLSERASPSSPSPRAPGPVGAYALTREELLVIARFFREAIASIHKARDAFRAMRRPDLPEYPASASPTVALMERLIPGSVQPTAPAPPSSSAAC